MFYYIVLYIGKIFILSTGKIFILSTGKIFILSTGKIFILSTGKIFILSTGKIFILSKCSNIIISRLPNLVVSKIVRFNSPYRDFPRCYIGMMGKLFSMLQISIKIVLFIAFSFPWLMDLSTLNYKR